MLIRKVAKLLNSRSFFIIFVTEQVVSSIPGSVGYIIAHVHRAYDYLGSFGVVWVHMA